jgi:glutathione S-transferase
MTLPLYAAPDEAAFAGKAEALSDKFTRLEDRLKAPPYFDGAAFSLVDATFGPVFRYFDVFDRIGDFGVLTGKPKVASWREALAERPSVRGAVTPGYDARLSTFLQARRSHLSRLMA